MKTLKYSLLGVILSSLVFSSFSIYPSKFSYAGADKVIFCATYTKQEVLSRLDPADNFFTLVQMEETDPEGSRIGICHENDLEHLWNHIKSEKFRDRVQEDLIIAAGHEVKNQMIALYAIRKSTSDQVFPLHQDLEEVRVERSDQENNYALLMTFSESGTKKWAALTRANKGKDIAILFNGKVIAAPRVREEIKNGKCMISGLYTEDEIRELKTILEH
jgi:SecD/SecF fusion protein